MYDVVIFNEGNDIYTAKGLNDGNKINVTS